jgi:hypothetical protein
MEKVRSENLNHAQATRAVVNVPASWVGSEFTSIGDWSIGENVSSSSLAAKKIESRPEAAADANTCTSSQSRNARLTLGLAPINSIPA